MELLKERIYKDGKVFPGDVLKVDSFLNHQIDAELLGKMGEEIYDLFKDCSVNKILTIEASGIALACFAAREFSCPCVFAKKAKTSNISDSVYTTGVHSYTHGVDYNIVVSKEFLNEGDNVLIVDDFLANGAAMNGLISLCEQAGARVVGCAAAIEKVFQNGGNSLREKGYRVEGLAKVLEMDGEAGTIVLE